MKQSRFFSLSLLIFLSVNPVRAASSENERAAIRLQFAQLGRLYVADEARRASGIKHPEASQDPGQVERGPHGIIRRYSPTSLAEAVGESIRQGTQEERIGAFNVYDDLIYEDNVPPNQDYLPLLVDLLDRDDFGSNQYTAALTLLLRLFPSRETVFAYMRAAERSPDARTKEAMEGFAAHLLGMSLRTTGMADFEAWFAKNKDRIEFDKKGKFRLAGNGPQADQEELKEEDRDRIRKDPVCVVHLLNDGLSGEGSAESVRTMMDRCGAALVGAESAETISKSLHATESGGEVDMELKASLGTLQGRYPMMAAYLLAAIYVVAYEKDPKELDLAKTALIRATPAEITRMTKGEPRWVRKKALEYAKPEGD